VTAGVVVALGFVERLASSAVVESSSIRFWEVGCCPRAVLEVRREAEVERGR
jgi:hypothetical protein